MKRLKSLRLPALALLGTLALGACDASEQNLTWEPGNAISLRGPFRAGASTPSADGGAGGVFLPLYPNDPTRSDVHFIVNDYDGNKTYTWTFNGQPMTLNRGSEVAIANIPVTTAPGPYTVRVVNSEGFAGELVVNVRRPALTVQIPRFSAFTTLGTALTSAAAPAATNTDATTGLTAAERCQLAGTNILATPACATAAAAGPLTVFAPNNAAFLAALDANNDGQLQASEIPAAGPLSAILRNHVVAGTLRPADLTAGRVLTTLSGRTLTVGRTGDQITLQLAGGTQATVVAPVDVLAANGVIHGINTVLR